MRMDPHNMVKYKAHATQIYASPKTCAHPPSPTHLHLSHRHLHHLHTPPPSLHLHHSLHTPLPSLPITSTIPYTHLHYPLHTPPLSPTHTSTIPYTHLYHPLHTPPPSPTHTSTIPYTHLHHPYTPPLSHTPISTICLPACRIYYRSNNYFRCPTSSPGQRPKTFCSKNVLRQIRHTLCAKSVIRFAPNPTYALRQIRHTLCAKSVIRFAPNPIWFYAKSFLCLMFWYATYRATVLIPFCSEPVCRIVSPGHQKSSIISNQCFLNGMQLNLDNRTLQFWSTFRIWI